MTDIDSENGPQLSVVVPVFNDIDNVRPFITRISAVLKSIDVEDYEIIFAIDPSDDGTEHLLQSLATEDARIRGLVFSRRVGQPTATLAGIDFARGSAVVVMDVDMQDPPELIPEMFKQWQEGSLVVYAKRRSRAGETWSKRAVAKLGYAVINKFGEVPIPRDTGDFRLMDRRVVDDLKKFPETHGFLRGLVALVGYKQTSVEFDRPPRERGRGSYNRYFGSLRIGFDGVIGFSSALLNLSTILGLAAASAAFFLATAYGILAFLGFPFPIGNPTIVTLMLFIGGTQLICIGILGQYLGRVYDEVKSRPRYLVDKHIGLQIERF